VPEVRVCSEADVPAPSARRFDVDGARLCVVHLGPADGEGEGAWYVIGDRCSHADYSLSEGDLWEDELEIECPKHGSTFSLKSGEPQTLPATQPVPVYGVRVVDGEVLVEVP
jgi:3-phenylpropionate/trans-cinnamate dioxygenase ferredoxin subunit